MFVQLPIFKRRQFCIFLKHFGEVAMAGEAQDSYDHTRVLALQEEIKTLPWGEVWDEYLKRQGMVSDAVMFEEVRAYEKTF